jgi:hypothetical protein
MAGARPRLSPGARCRVLEECLARATLLEIAILRQLSALSMPDGCWHSKAEAKQGAQN